VRIKMKDIKKIEEKEKRKKVVTNIIVGILGLIKAFFQAVAQVAWGLAGIFLFNLVLTYLLKSNQIDTTTINKTFLMVAQIIINNLMIFFWAIFLIYVFYEIKEIVKE